MDFFNQFKFNAPALADVLALLNVKTFTPEDVERFNALADDEKRAVLAISEEYAGLEDSIGDMIDAYENGTITAYTWVDCRGEDHLAPIAEDCAENWDVLAEIPEHLRGYFDVEKWFFDVQLEGSWAWARRAGCWVEYRG